MSPSTADSPSPSTPRATSARPTKATIAPYQIAPAHIGYQGKVPNANWIDLTSFTDPAAGTFGTTRRNAFYGPGFADVDFSVFKDTKIKERATIQFRAELFNLFNRTNFAPPGGGSVSVGGDRHPQ